jgi:hypothetical protein
LPQKEKPIKIPQQQNPRNTNNLNKNPKPLSNKATALFKKIKNKTQLISIKP